MSTIKKNSILNVLYTLVNILFPIAASVYAGRVLMATRVGTVTYAQNYASYFIMIASSGMDIYGIREISKINKGDSKKGEVEKVFNELFSINFFLTLFALLCYGIINIFRGNAINPIYLVFGLQILFNFFNVDWFYQGIEDYKYIVKRGVIVKTLVLIMIFLTVKSEKDYVIYAMWIALVGVLNYICNLWNLMKQIKIRIGVVGLRKHYMPLLMLAVSTWLSLFYSKLDISMLGAMKGDTAVGLYSTAHRVIFMIVTVSTAVSNVFFPKMNVLYKENYDKFCKLITAGIEYISAIVFPMIILCIYYAGEMIVFLWGESFKGTEYILLFLIPIAFFQSFGNLLCYQLMICIGKEKERIPAYAIACILNVILNILLIPKFGAIGAAIASSFSEMSVNLVQFIYVRKIINIRVAPKSVLGISTSIFLTFIITAFIHHIVTNFILGMIFSVAGIATIQGIHAIFIDNSNIKDKILENI